MQALLGRLALFEGLLLGVVLQVKFMGLQNALEGLVLLLHFLVVAAALVCSSCPNIVTHTPEDLIGPAQFVLEEMVLVQGQERII